jgi:large subunit ribosomal protein L25
MDSLQLSCQPRSEKKAKHIRQDGYVLIECYGPGEENISAQAAYNEFRRVFLDGGYNTIVTLDIEGGKKVDVIIHDVQVHPVTDDYVHADCVLIKKGQEITASVPLVFVNNAPVVKAEGAILIHARDELEITCLPKDLIHEIEVDLSSLVDMHTNITVANLQVPAGIKFNDPVETLICSVTAPKTAEQEEAESAANEQAAPVEEEAAEGEEKSEG